MLVGMDTGVVEKDSKPEYRPGFMDHFDKKEEQKKKVGRKQGPQGPHDISYYFPDIPDGMHFRDFVRPHLLPLFLFASCMRVTVRNKLMLN